MALFFQTFVFVTLNKVITAQYFEWYMCLFPLILPYFHLSLGRWIGIFALWSAAILHWLLPAYLLEFHQWNVIHWVGSASITYVINHISLLWYLHYEFNEKINPN